MTPTLDERLVGLAFPVIRVRYAGPTNSRSSRYIATLRGIRSTQSYDYSLSGPQNAFEVAARCWNKYREAHAEAYERDEQEPVFIPGDLDANSYAFTVVPRGFLS